MVQKLAILGVMILLQAAPAWAQAQPTAPLGSAVAKDPEQPGSLSRRDVVGKRLLDDDGALMGTIVGVSADGRSAILRPAGGGKRSTIAMSGLSIGMSSHTVTDDINSSARALNARNLATGPAVTGQSSSEADTAPRPFVSSQTITTTTSVQPATLPGN